MINEREPGFEGDDGFDCHPVLVQGFDYDEVDRRLGLNGHSLEPDFEDLRQRLFHSIRKILEWCRSGDRGKYRALRLSAAYFFFAGKTQAQLAREDGLTRAAISKAANMFRDEFRLDDLLSRSPGMRDNETRERFSVECTQRHRKQKKLSASETSPTKSIDFTPRHSAIVTKRLVQGRPQ